MTCLRAINKADLQDVQSLIHNTIKRCYPIIYPQSVVQFFLNYHSLNALEDRMHKGDVIVLAEGTQLLGTGFLVGNELGGVYVHPEHQKKGYGTEIVLHLLEIACHKKLDAIWLDATPIAKPLYDKLGFKLISPMIQLINGQVLNYFKMEMVLTTAPE